MSIFRGEMLVPIYIQPISCTVEFGYVPISQKPDLKFIIKLLHNFLFYFLGKLFIFLDES